MVTNDKDHPHHHSAATVNEPVDACACIERLKEQGFRITKVRRALVELIADASQPLSAIDLLAELSIRDLSVNKTTVYRELDFLLLHHAIIEIDLLDGMKRYELLRSEEHHHHLVCTKCRKIQCIEMNNDLDDLEKRIRRRHQFRVESHILEFFGLCSACELC